MIVNYRKKFKKFEFSVELGFMGKKYLFGDVPESYLKNKDNNEYLKNMGLFEESVSLILLPTVSYNNNSHRSCIAFYWLFLKLFLSKNHKK